MENIFSLVEFGFDSFGRDVTGGKNIQQFTDELYKGTYAYACVRSCVLN